MGINCTYKRAWLATGTMFINLDLVKLGLSRGYLQGSRQSTTNDLHLFPKANLYPQGIMRSVMGIIRSMKSFGSDHLKLRHVCEISLPKEVLKVASNSRTQLLQGTRFRVSDCDHAAQAVIEPGAPPHPFWRSKR